MEIRITGKIPIDTRQCESALPTAGGSDEGGGDVETGDIHIQD